MQNVTQEEYWAKVPYWVLTHPELDAYAVRVYCVLSKHANKERRSFPGVRLIAEECHCSTNTVLKSLLELEGQGAIVVFREKHGNRPKVNQYHLPMFRVSPGNTWPESDVSPQETHVSPGATPHVSPGATELDPKNQRTREADLNLENPDPLLPGESQWERVQRISTRHLEQGVVGLGL